MNKLHRSAFDFASLCLLTTSHESRLNLQSTEVFNRQVAESGAI